MNIFLNNILDIFSVSYRVTMYTEIALSQKKNFPCLRDKFIPSKLDLCPSIYCTRHDMGTACDQKMPCVEPVSHPMHCNPC